MAKRPQEGDYDERFVAKSKPVRNVEKRSRAGPSTTPSSTVSSGPRKFGSKDREMRFEANTGQLAVENSQEDLIKGDTVTNSQVRHLSTRSKTSTGSPMTRKPSQTKNFKACRVYLVPVTKSLDTDIGLEARKECNILSATSISFREKVDERLRVALNRPPDDKMEGVDKNSLIRRMFMTSSMHARHPKYRSKTNCTEIVRCDSNIDSRTRFGDLGSVKIKLGYFEMGEAVPGRRPGGDQGRFMYSLTLYCVLENA